MLKDYVIWGTGRIGQSFYRKYICENPKTARPLFWCDGNTSKQGTTVDGIQVLSPAETFKLAYKYFVSGRELTLVIAVAGINLLQIIGMLEKNSVKASLISAVQLMAIEYFDTETVKLAAVSEMLADEKSKKLYKIVIDNMKKGRGIDFSIAEPNQYFGNDVIAELTAGDVLVDAGVCQGEEVDKALHNYPGVRVYAFEPDRNSYSELKKKYQEEHNVTLYPKALWNEHVYMNLLTGNVAEASYIDMNEIQTSSGEGQSENVVECDTLDNVLSGKEISMLKMDIEGAEYNALLGAKETIVKCRPKLAICVYHNIQDYVEIPLLIKGFLPDYQFYFRHHSVTGTESVLYAI